MSFQIGFSVAQKKRNQKTDSVSFGRFRSTAHSNKKTTENNRQFGGEKKRPKPPDIFGEKTKTDRAIYICGLLRFTTLVATWYQHMHTELFEMLSF